MTKAPELALADAQALDVFDAERDAVRPFFEGMT